MRYSARFIYLRPPNLTCESVKSARAARLRFPVLSLAWPSTYSPGFLLAYAAYEAAKAEKKIPDQRSKMKEAPGPKLARNPGASRVECYGC